jgi:hypothetical protein
MIHPAEKYHDVGKSAPIHRLGNRSNLSLERFAS